MKIAFIVGVFPAISETFILNQITGLLDMGHDIEIFAQVNPRDKKIHSDIEKYDLQSKVQYSYRSLNKFRVFCRLIYLILFNFKDVVKLFKIRDIFKDYKKIPLLIPLVIAFKNKKFDIIQCHFGPNGILGAFLKELGVEGKIVTMFHGYDIRLGINKGGDIYNNLFEHADCILANSDYSYRHLMMFRPSSKKIILHPVGVNLEKFSFRWTNGGVKDLNPISIVTVARLSEEKGLEYGIRGISELIKCNPELRLEYQIVGGGHLERNLRKLVEELKLSEVVYFFGSQNQEEVIQIFQQAHIFLLPSIAEALPVVLMEAQAVGLPVVATSVGSVSQIVIDRKTGFLVPSRDVDALTEKLNYLIENPQIWLRMGREGRRFVEENFDIKKLNKELEGIYQQVMRS
jgi:colanic acid/amylovoran biosynthesis glycosyltransferase